MVGAVEIPGEEAGEVLDCADGFVAADYKLLLAWFARRWRLRVEVGVPVVATNLL